MHIRGMREGAPGSLTFGSLNLVQPMWTFARDRNKVLSFFFLFVTCFLSPVGRP